MGELDANEFIHPEYAEMLPVWSRSIRAQ